MADEIRLKGYGGGITQVRDYVHRLRQAQATLVVSGDIACLPSELAAKPWTPRRTAFWLLQPVAENDPVHTAG